MGEMGHELVRAQSLEPASRNALESNHRGRTTELKDPIQAPAAWGEALPFRDYRNRNRWSLPGRRHRRQGIHLGMDIVRTECVLHVTTRKNVALSRQNSRTHLCPAVHMRVFAYRPGLLGQSLPGNGLNLSLFWPHLCFHSPHYAVPSRRSDGPAGSASAR